MLLNGEFLLLVLLREGGGPLCPVGPHGEAPVLGGAEGAARESLVHSLLGGFLWERQARQGRYLETGLCE